MDIKKLKHLVDKVEEIARIEESIQALEQVIESDQEMPEPTVDCHRFDAVVPPLSEAEAEAMAKELEASLSSPAGAATEAQALEQAAPAPPVQETRADHVDARLKGEVVGGKNQDRERAILWPQPADALLAWVRERFTHFDTIPLSICPPSVVIATNVLGSSTDAISTRRDIPLPEHLRRRHHWIGTLEIVQFYEQPKEGTARYRIDALPSLEGSIAGPPLRLIVSADTDISNEATLSPTMRSVRFDQDLPCDWDKLYVHIAID